MTKKPHTHTSENHESQCNTGVELHTRDDEMMNVALEMAKKAYDLDEVPVGAAIFDKSGNLICAEHNRTRELNDPTAHAELLAIKKACQTLETQNLSDYILAVTLEPCAMCAAATAWAKVGEIRFGAYDIKSGGTVNGARIFDWKTCHHRPEVYGGIMERICGQLIREFFQKKR
jgi:tRNA(adenine34) deaminase